jgi:hypothetical protein
LIEGLSCIPENVIFGIYNAVCVRQGIVGYVKKLMPHFFFVFIDVSIVNSCALYSIV